MKYKSLCDRKYWEIIEYERQSEGKMYTVNITTIVTHLIFVFFYIVKVRRK